MKQSFNLKTMFSLFLAAPFIVLIVMIFIFMGIAESRRTNSRYLEAPKYLSLPLLEIIENGYAPADRPLGVLILMDSDGTILYSSSSDIPDFHENGALLLRSMVDLGPDNISISRYIYKGAAYYCFFDNSMFPAVYRQQIRIGASLFIVIISCLGLFFGQISSIIINSSIRRLIDASNLIAEGNLDEKVTLKYNNELIHVANAIDRMRVELREKRNVEQRFVMSVTHDLKTPLTSINGYLEALADGVITDPEDVRQTVEMMQNKSSLLDNRINELLEYSRSRTAGWRENWKEINLAGWLENISAMFRSDAELYGRQYVRSIGIGGDVVIKGDEKLLSRALENLFDNACRYTEAGDTIVLSAAMTEHAGRKTVEILVEDSGSGINPEDMDKIFELFYRNDRGRNSRGMGIGLASVRTIIEDHGGAISCSNSRSGGACFRIELEL